MTEEIKCLCFNLARKSKSIQFILLALTVLFFHITQGYMHELIFRLPGFKPFTLEMTLLQFFFYSLFAFIETLIIEGAKFNFSRNRKVDMTTYFLIAFLTVATLGLSNAAVAHLNFTTFCMFKSSKLIPVMIGSVIILGKKYNTCDKLAVVFMTFGLIFFTLADTQLYPNFETFGVVLVCSALIADALIGNVQEKAMKKYRSSNTEMILYSYSIGVFYILLWEILVSNRLFEAIDFCNQHPYETYGYIFFYSFVGFFGLNVVLTLVKQFGALVAVTVTSFRKAITIFLSFILFSKPFAFQYVWSGLLVLIGIYLNLYSKNKTSWDIYFKNSYIRFRIYLLRRRIKQQAEVKHFV